MIFCCVREAYFKKTRCMAIRVCGCTTCLLCFVKGCIYFSLQVQLVSSGNSSNLGWKVIYYSVFGHVKYYISIVFSLSMRHE